MRKVTALMTIGTIVLIILVGILMIAKAREKQQPTIFGCGANTNHSVHEFYANGMPKKIECWYIQIHTNAKFL